MAGEPRWNRKRDAVVVVDVPVGQRHVWRVHLADMLVAAVRGILGPDQVEVPCLRVPRCERRRHQAALVRRKQARAVVEDVAVVLELPEQNILRFALAVVLAIPLVSVLVALVDY